jgi:thiamine kinase-like enzyme
LTLDLPTFDRLDEVESLLAEMRPAEIGTRADLEAVQRELALARERLHLTEIVSRPIHGDAHFGNILRTTKGPVWADLENVCAGPVEYDLACLVWRERVHGHASAKDTLAAYGPHDAELIETLMPALGVFLATWAIAIARRRPSPVAEAYANERLSYVRNL